MESFSCLAVDMGAGSIRIVQGIFTDKLVVNEIYRFENHIEWMNGADRWNLNTITDGIRKGITLAFEQTEVPVLSVGVDSWGVDFVLLDKTGKPVEDAVSYRDSRTVGMKEKWNELIPALETFQLTGINYNIFNSLYQLLSIKDSVQLKDTNRILFMADYVNYLLSGKSVNELTLSASSQMVNYKNADFDPDILSLLNCNSLFSKPVLPGMRLGKLTGFEHNNTEVITVAGHDTASAVAAIPFTDKNAAYISTGTWCIIGMLSDQPFISDRAFTMGITNEVTADGKYRPSMNLIGLWLVQQLRVAFGSHSSFSDIEELISTTPTSAYLIDTSDESFYNPVNMKEAFDNFLKDHWGIEFNTEAAYYRCAYDSLAESFRKKLLSFEELRGEPFNTIHLIGGGCRSKLLCQLTANATGKKVIAGPVEAAVMGNLMIQVESLGKMNPECRKMISESMAIATYLPEKEGTL